MRITQIWIRQKYFVINFNFHIFFLNKSRQHCSKNGENLICLCLQKRKGGDLFLQQQWEIESRGAEKRYFPTTLRKLFLLVFFAIFGLSKECTRAAKNMNFQVIKIFINFRAFTQFFTIERKYGKVVRARVGVGRKGGGKYEKSAKSRKFSLFFCWKQFFSFTNFFMVLLLHAQQHKIINSFELQRRRRD